MRDKDELAARQAQLQKALSTAYLNHQISELENRVHAIDLPNGQHHRRMDSTSSQGGRDGRGGVRGYGRGRGGGGGNRGPRDDRRGTEDSDGEGESRDEEKAWTVVVLDVSALLWAPKAVKRLVGKGWEVIVPLEALRSLDVLKKGNSPCAQAARAAARYIEHASRHHRLLSADPSINVQLGTHYKRGRGLRLQRNEETRHPETISELVMPSLDGEQLPKWLTSVLSCAAFFLTIADAEAVQLNETSGNEFSEAKAVLYVANPPLSVEVEMTEGDRKGENGISYAERGEGYLVSQEAERFELSLEVLRDEDAEDFGFHSDRGQGREHGSAGRRRGRGRGHELNGRGGNGRGGGGGRGGARKPPQEEPAREIKILLRRPQSNDERSPSTNRSPLPPVFEPPQASEHLSPLLSNEIIRPPLDHALPPPPEHVPPPPPGHRTPPPAGHRAPPPPGGFARPPPDHDPFPPPGHSPHHFPWHGPRPPFDRMGRLPPPPPPPGHHYHYGSLQGRPPPFVPDLHHYPRPLPEAFREDRGRGGRGRGGSDGFRGQEGDRGRGGFTLLQRPGPARETASIRPPVRPEVPIAPKIVLLQRPK